MPLDINALRAKAETHGQGHLFHFYDSLTLQNQVKLLNQIASIDFDLIDKLVADFVKGHAESSSAGILPAPVIVVPSNDAQRTVRAQARSIGEAAFRAGRVACFLVAGGQGTRLGLHGPKGAFQIGPLSSRTLFQVHAEKILALRRRYEATVPWLIMTSDANDAETRRFFEEHNYFGLDADSVRIFKQANMPAVDRQGKILMQAPDEIALSPNGHGGSIKALNDSGSVSWLQSQNIDTLFYFQVDNVLTQIGDPVFIGYHLQAMAQMSSKVVRKRDWKEKVGVVALRDGKLSVVEYSDLPEELARQNDASGNLKFWAGSIAIHVIDVNFVERLNRGGFQLPYHKAEKAVQAIGLDGKPLATKPGEKNGIKFETFVFDALSQTERSITMETLRQDDFSPVKNADGEDSAATARRDIMEQYARWMHAAGTTTPRKIDNTLNCRIEISPLTSLEGEGLEKAPRHIEPGQDLLL